MNYKLIINKYFLEIQAQKTLFWTLTKFKFIKAYFTINQLLLKFLNVFFILSFLS